MIQAGGDSPGGPSSPRSSRPQQSPRRRQRALLMDDPGALDCPQKVTENMGVGHMFEHIIYIYIYHIIYIYILNLIELQSVEKR